MTKRTPEQRIADLEERRAKVEAKLRAEREIIVRAKRREHAKILNRKRKDDTRRKILVGALWFEQIAQLDDQDKIERAKRRLMEKMNRFLTRNGDRKLFGLEPIEPVSDKNPKIK